MVTVTDALPFESKVLEVGLNAVQFIPMFVGSTPPGGTPGPVTSGQEGVGVEPIEGKKVTVTPL
jgi:hypothetical protein